jgi:hypothetical protein
MGMSITYEQALSMRCKDLSQLNHDELLIIRGMAALMVQVYRAIGTEWDVLPHLSLVTKATLAIADQVIRRA